MSKDRQTSARDWGQLIHFVTSPADDRDSAAALALAMSLGSAIIPDGLACSVTLITASGYYTPVWSDALALDLDRAQYDSGTGPCVATAQDGRPHTIEVMAEETRYPAFAAAAVTSGVKCSLSVPLSERAVPGALNLYARTTSAYGAGRTRATAELLARCVGRLLADHQPSDHQPTHHRSADDPDRRYPGLADALERRGLIERAEVELIRQGADDETEAYVWMTRLSRSENRSIFAIAADLVDNGSSAGGGSPQAARS